jgi:phosphoglycolate phosphatase-like HAD superfamily hydrolase
LSNLIIFDLDGVITSEEAYWDSAGLTLHELLCSPRYWNVSGQIDYQPAASAQQSREISRGALPAWLILSFKARALNSNWDTCYAAVCLHFLDLLACLPERAHLLPLEPGSAEWLRKLRMQLAHLPPATVPEHVSAHDRWRQQHPFDLPIFQQATGLQLFEHLDAYASVVLQTQVTGVFARRRPFWRFCQQLFQEWLLGDALYRQTYGHPPAQKGKPGCLFFEEPLLPVQEIRESLATLSAAGYTLGIASGRIYQEAALPLEKYDLLRYFDTAHLGTYDLVTRAEKELRAHGLTPMLGKPHPFHFQAAVDWQQALEYASAGTPEALDVPFIVVGDSTSDILGGRRAGAVTVAVLTGARSPEAHALLLKSGPDFVLEDVTGLPALLLHLDSLTVIQQMQFSRRKLAEQLLRLWFARHMDRSVQLLRLTPGEGSLNGFYQSDGQEFFFKTHGESHGALYEDNRSGLLEAAGYHVVRPAQLLREKELQMAAYPTVKWPLMLDLIRALETGQQLPAGLTARTLIEVEEHECAHILAIYQRTLQTDQTPHSAPIHQLFWHGLSGTRLQTLYAGKTLPLPGGSQLTACSFADIERYHWTINGRTHTYSLGELITQAREVLHPDRARASIVGHATAHCGNVLLEREQPDSSTSTSGAPYRYLLLDPAFAGRHAPLLDLVKPLYHNVFATWMYFPAEVAPNLNLRIQLRGEQVHLEQNDSLSPIRLALLRTRYEKLLMPLVTWLEGQHALPEEWQKFLHLALMCCPLLTVNLCEMTQISPAISWLGLAQAVQLGNSGLAPWLEQAGCR